MDEKVIYKLKRGKLLPFVLFFIMTSVVTVTFVSFRDMVPFIDTLSEEIGVIYILLLFYLFIFIICNSLSKGSIEVTNERFIHKSQNNIIDEVEIKNITYISLSEEKGALYGPSRGPSASYYINMTDNQENELKINCTGYPQEEIDEIVSYIKSRIQSWSRDPRIS